MSEDKEDGAAMSKVRIDEIPPEIKLIIIGAIDLCGRVGTWAEYTVRDDVSDKEACMKASDMLSSRSMLYANLRRTFAWKDILKMMEDIGIGDGQSRSPGNETDASNGLAALIDPSVSGASMGVP